MIHAVWARLCRAMRQCAAAPGASRLSPAVFGEAIRLLVFPVSGYHGVAAGNPPEVTAEQCAYVLESHPGHNQRRTGAQMFGRSGAVGDNRFVPGKRLGFLVDFITRDDY